LKLSGKIKNSRQNRREKKKIEQNTKEDSSRSIHHPVEYKPLIKKKIKKLKK
jgi:hypothetical protein